MKNVITISIQSSTQANNIILSRAHAYQASNSKWNIITEIKLYVLIIHIGYSFMESKYNEKKGKYVLHYSVAAWTMCFWHAQLPS